MLLPNVYNLGYTVGAAVKSLLIDKTVPSSMDAWGFVRQLPMLYKDWWLNLVMDDPLHVLVETTLLISVLYMVISSRSKDYRTKERLTTAEQEELLREWKLNRGQLAPEQVSLESPLVVHAMNGRTLQVVRQKSDDDDDNNNNNIVQNVLNFATLDFLSMSTHPQVKEASREALSRYGCGSCGPRGFYGTLDVHLKLEEEMTKFTATEGAIMYSDGASTVSSTIAAFAKRGDLLVVDAGVYEPIVTGVTLSRANVQWFRHNDMEDLRRVLEKVQKTDNSLKRKPNAQRRFIIVEGLYKDSGSIVPFDELAALKHEFNYRLILDESMSFGAIGPSGKGVLDLYKKRYMYDAEIVTISLENSLGSIGGVTVGNEEVVDHQRLSGAGYCFSASSPPFTASAAIQSLKLLESKPDVLKSLQANIVAFNSSLRAVVAKDNRLVITSDERSPIVFLELEAPGDQAIDYDEAYAILDKIVASCLQQDMAVVLCKNATVPSIRMTVTASHTANDLETATKALEKAISEVLQ